jgi:phosphonate transport system substrate-binding protein
MLKLLQVIHQISRHAARMACFGAVLLSLTACLTPTPAATPGPIQTPTATVTPTPTATPMPLGSEPNPIIIGLVAESNGQGIAQPAADLAARISTGSGISIKSRVFIGYKELLNAMAAGEAHIVFLPPLTYLYASKRGLAEASMLINHFGVYTYGSQFLANASSGFTIYYDPLSGKNSASAADALAQFKDKKPCYVDSNSTSGYILPAGLMAVENIDTQAPAFTQSHVSVVRSLYVKGVCDFGATFAISGDPRTAADVLNDLPDALDRIPVVWQSDALIPNINVSYIAGLQESHRSALTSAFLDLASTPEGRALVAAALEGYEIDALRPVEDPLYDPLRSMVDALAIELEGMLGK